MTELKSVLMLSYLTPEMLKKVEAAGANKIYEAGQYIHEKGGSADWLYAILSGKVAIEVEKGKTIQVLEPGMTFGLSSMIEVEDKKNVSFAKATASTTVFQWRAKDLDALFEKDYHLGFVFMKRIAKILKTRLAARDAAK